MHIYSAKIIEALKDKNIHNVTLYCAHHYTKTLIPYLRKNKINIDNIIDSSVANQDSKFDLFYVQKPSLLAKITDDTTIVISHFKHIEAIVKTIRYYLSQNPNKVQITILDYEGNITYVPPLKEDSLKIKISEKIRGKEHESLQMDKPWSLNNFANLYFNRKNHTNNYPKIQNNTVLNLESFELLKFHKAEVHTHGGVFVCRKLKKESLFINHIYEGIETILDNYLYRRYNLKQLALNAISYIYYWKIRKKKKIVFCCPPTHNKNFGHFVTESYPRLYSTLIELKKNNEKDFYVICPTKDKNIYNGYIDPILDSLEIDEKRRIYPNFGFDDRHDKRWFVKKFFTSRYFLNFQNILLPTSVSLNPAYCMPAFEHLKEYFFDKSFCWDHKKIYISRKNANWRKLTNESEVENLLETKYGFKTIAIEEYSFKETINILMRTEVVVAPEGAVHGNMIFLPKNAKMIGLRAKDFQEYAIFSSSMIGYEQLFIVCDIVNPKEFAYGLNKGYWYGSDIHVSLEYLEQKLADYEIFPA